MILFSYMFKDLIYKRYFISIVKFEFEFRERIRGNSFMYSIFLLGVILFFNYMR